MDIHIDNINSFENRNKVNTIEWRPIYEVLEKGQFKYSEICPDDFMKQCKDNVNEAKFITLELIITQN